MQFTDVMLAIVAMGFTGTAMYFDLKYRKIPNWLTVSVFVLGFAFHIATSGVAGLTFALGGFAAGFLPLLVLWLIGGGGGGDVKMMGALGTWLGAPVTLIVFLGSAIVALVMMIGMLAWKALSRTATSTSPSASGGQSTVVKMEHAQRLIPYAVPVTVMTWGWLLTKLALASLS